MKQVFTLLAITLMFLSVANAQTVIESFDNAAADSAFAPNVEGDLSSITFTDNSTDFVEGTGSFKIKPVIGAYHQWGSFAHAEKKIADSTYVNWLPYDTLSIKIKVHEAPSIPANWLFRMHIQDQLSWDGNVEEYIYENTTILDNVTDGWVELKIPLIDRDLNGTDLPNDQGFCFIPSAWYAASTNNQKIDWDKIVYWTLTFVTSGWDPAVNLPADSMVVSFDELKSVSNRSIPFVMFNGKTYNPDFSAPWAWGQSSVSIEENAGATAKTHAIKWTQGNEWGNGWSGIGWDIDPMFDMSTVWDTDTLKFKMKAEDGVGTIRLQFEDINSAANDGKKGTFVTPIADNQWHDYAIALADFDFTENSPTFDNSQIKAFGIMAEASAVAGKVIYFDDMWTGNPTFDIVAPDEPQGVLASADAFQNIVTWLDVPGEAGETYTIYADFEEITDATKPGVDIVARNVTEGTQFVNHVLLSPATNQEVTFYYAIKCMDLAGNESPVVQIGSVTNTAKGVTVIQPAAPAGFAVDGDLSEWANVAPFRLFPDDGSGAIVTGQDIDGDADCSMNAWVALDAEYLYVAMDVEDDIVVTDTTKASYLVDGADLFIGFYNGQYVHHTAYKGDSEADYHFRFAYTGVIVDNIGSGVWMPNTDPNYVWEEKFPTGYRLEAKISLAALATYGEDNVFTPIPGMRMPIDFAVNDADATGTREGILTFSKNNEDKSYQDVSRWTYTWLGADAVLNTEGEEGVPVEYSLEQNYPNPFNPATKIAYTLKQNSDVSLKVYNMLGQEVARLVNEKQNIGRYEVSFDASHLASGLYIYQITTNDFVSAKKMLLLK